MKPYTQEESRQAFMDHVRGAIDYWANSDCTKEYACNGVAHSILCILDGVSGNFPACNVTLEPHPDDRQYDIDNGEKYYEPGQLINDCYLHDLL